MGTSVHTRSQYSYCCRGCRCCCVSVLSTSSFAFDLLVVWLWGIALSPSLFTTLFFSHSFSYFIEFHLFILFATSLCILMCMHSGSSTRMPCLCGVTQYTLTLVKRSEKVALCHNLHYYNNWMIWNSLLRAQRRRRRRQRLRWRNYIYIDVNIYFPFACKHQHMQTHTLTIKTK